MSSSDILLASLNFNINGSLITGAGVIPNYRRSSRSFAEYEINGSLRWIPFAQDQPRFSSSGSLQLERGSQNLCPFSTDFRHSSWIKGGSWSILSNLVPSPSGAPTADRATVAKTLGNTDAQTMYRDIVVGSGQTYTATLFVRLAGGRFGPNCVFRVTGDVAQTRSQALGAVLNDDPENWTAISLTFTTAGTAPALYETDDTPRTVRVGIYVEEPVSFDLGGIQVEPGTIQTSFVEAEEPSKIATRDADSVVYQRSPAEGLQSFLFYMNLEMWRGDGLIVNAGNFRVEIVGGKLRASCGAVVSTDPDNLPAAARIAVRVSRGLERLRLYVNGVLKTSEVLTGYVATAGNMTLCGEGVRQLRCAYFFNRDIGDGAIATGQPVLADMLRLFTQDSLFPQLAEGHGQLAFSPIKVPVGAKQSVKMPQQRLTSQDMSVVTPGAGSVAQSLRIHVQNIVNAAASQRDSIIINNTTFNFVSDATPTAAEIAAGFATMINNAPKLQPVTAVHTPGNTFVTVTADVAGVPFYCSVSANLAIEGVAANITDAYTVTVTTAVDYQVGVASIFRDFVWITDVVIETINTGNNTIVLRVEDNARFNLIRVGDALVQSNWQVRIGTNSYFVHHLENHPDIKVARKTDEEFVFRNVGSVDRIVTPYVRVTL